MIKSHQCKDVTCMLYLYICIESFDSFGTNATSQSLARSNSFVINIIRYHAVGYFSKSGDDLLLSDWWDMTTCLVMSHLALSYMAQNKPFPYMLMIASNTICYCYAQCSCEIYFCKLQNVYPYSLKNMMWWKLPKAQAKWNQARQHKGVPCFEQYYTFPWQWSWNQFWWICSLVYSW